MLSRSLAVLACLVLVEHDARPCSIMLEPNGGSLPPQGATVGPLPLLSSPGGGSLSATATPDVVIPLVEDTTFGVIHGHGFGSTIQLWRPAEPLPSGSYTWMGAGEVTFFVDAELVAEEPPTREATLRVRLTEPEEDAGGCDFGGSGAAATTSTSRASTWSSDRPAISATHRRCSCSR